MRFTDSHEWITVEENIGKVGITDHAQKELGEIVYVQLPEVGEAVKAGQEVCVLESTKAAADIYAPVSGTVIAVNEALKKSPQNLNQSETWLFQVELSNPSELEELLSPADYQNLIS